MFRNWITTGLIGLSLCALVACSGQDPSLTDTGAPTTVPATNPPTAAVTAVPAAALPAPLYYLDSADSQIWRIEPDGATRTAVTHADAPVTDFDLSPVDGALAYVSGNTLFVADAMGGNATVLWAGPEPADAQFIHDQVLAPRWTRDGQSLAYGFNGLQIIAAQGGTPTTLYTPAAGIEGSGQFAEYPNPIAWSPDGTQLLVEMRAVPHGLTLATFARTGGALTLLSQDNIDMCCYATWSADSRSVYYAYNIAAMWAPGLWRVDVQPPAENALIEYNPNGPITFVTNPFDAGNGQLYFFAGQLEKLDETGSAPRSAPLTMYRADAAGQKREALNHDARWISDALWAPDARGAVVVSTAGPQHGVSAEGAGDLLWLTVGSELTVKLPGHGWHARWGR